TVCCWKPASFPYSSLHPFTNQSWPLLIQRREPATYYCNGHSFESISRPVWRRSYIGIPNVASLVAWPTISRKAHYARGLAGTCSTSDIGFTQLRCTPH